MQIFLIFCNYFKFSASHITLTSTSTSTIVHIKNLQRFLVARSRLPTNLIFDIYATMSSSKKNQNVSSKMDSETNEVKDNRVNRIIDNDNENISVGDPSSPEIMSHKQKRSDQDDQSSDDLYEKSTKKKSSAKMPKKVKSHIRENSKDDDGNDDGGDGDDDDDDDDGMDFTISASKRNLAKVSHEGEKIKKQVIPMSDHSNIVKVIISARNQAKLSSNNLRQVF
jgi:hypothetical protein